MSGPVYDITKKKLSLKVIIFVGTDYVGACLQLCCQFISQEHSFIAAAAESCVVYGHSLQLTQSVW